MGEASDGWGLEEAAQRDLDVEFFEQAREHLSGEQGMAAEVEEVIVDAELIDAQDFREDVGDGLFVFGARADVLLF